MQSISILIIFSVIIRISHAFTSTSNLSSIHHQSPHGLYIRKLTQQNVAGRVPLVCSMSSNSNDNSKFWESQKKLAESMSEIAESYEEADLKLSEKEKYNKQVNALVSETFYFSVILFSAVWFSAPDPFTAVSYLLGALLGTAYCYGLGKYVQTLGGSAYDIEDVQGSGVGSARFAFLIVLFILVGKFRSEGLQEIPAIMGFFTYQLSTLSQGLKDAAD